MGRNQFPKGLLLLFAIGCLLSGVFFLLYAYRKGFVFWGDKGWRGSFSYNRIYKRDNPRGYWAVMLLQTFLVVVSAAASVWVYYCYSN